MGEGEVFVFFLFSIKHGEPLTLQAIAQINSTCMMNHLNQDGSTVPPILDHPEPGLGFSKWQALKILQHNEHGQLLRLPNHSGRAGDIT